MARKSGLYQTMVSHIWRAFALQLHRVEGFKLSKDPLSVQKVRDVGLSFNPPDKALVLCLDEKAQIKAARAGFCAIAASTSTSLPPAVLGSTWLSSG